MSSHIKEGKGNGDKGAAPKLGPFSYIKVKQLWFSAFLWYWCYDLFQQNLFLITLKITPSNFH